MSQTRIFVSSTYYDLIHIRQALNRHIEELGHVPVMSEFATFRVDPQLTTIENCRENVRDNADFFLLIVGGRRGSVDRQTGRSIVNLEYEAAVREGLDVIVFVEQAVLDLVPIWQANIGMSFTPTVDDNEVFQFIKRIREEQRWTFPFSKEADIFDVLSLQLSAQLRELLRSRRSGQLSSAELFKNETRAALTIFRTRPRYWEYLLTAELFASRFSGIKKRYEDIQNGRVLGVHQTLSGREFLKWTTSKFPEAMGAVNKMAFIITNQVPEAWGPSGVSGKPEELLSVAEEARLTLNALLDLESDVYRTHGPEAAEPVRQALLGMTQEIFTEVESLPSRLRILVEQATHHKEGEPPPDSEINLTFTFSRGEALTQALGSMTQNIAPQDWDAY